MGTGRSALAPWSAGSSWCASSALARFWYAATQSDRAAEEDRFRLTAVAIAEHALGNRAEPDRALADLIRRAACVAAYQIAQVHAFRGERGRAPDWLERG